jgi:putative DNA primase/helicase
LKVLARKAARWAADHMDALREADPAIPPELNDRAADNWRPLLAIADLVGGDWPVWARSAALELSTGAAAEDDSMRTTLLGDIRGYFDSKGVDRVTTIDMVMHLMGLDDRPWSDMNRGHPINRSTLGRLLKPFGVRSRNIRIEVTMGKRTTTQVAKGLLRSSFEDAFSRYLAPAVPEEKAV